jgi:hypothetical protein
VSVCPMGRPSNSVKFIDGLRKLPVAGGRGRVMCVSLDSIQLRAATDADAQAGLYRFTGPVPGAVRATALGVSAGRSGQLQ